MEKTNPPHVPWTVTITGADDWVDPDELLEIGKAYPFVEWGILFSKARSGTRRYPSQGWKLALYRRAWTAEAKLSAHLCGSQAKDMMQGRGLDVPIGLFQRVQINGFELATSQDMILDPGFDEMILQAGSHESLPEMARFVQQRPEQKMSVLIDASAGKGVRPSSWPRPPIGAKFGFAGGIDPDNVKDVLRQLRHFKPTWIDMESGVRTNDAFDLDKVRRVLDQVKDFHLETT